MKQILSAVARGPGRTPDGQGAGTALLVLKQDGSKVTGTAEAGEVLITMVRENGTMRFSLKVDGNEMTGDVTLERDGRTQTAKLAVKRSK